MIVSLLNGLRTLGQRFAKPAVIAATVAVLLAPFVAGCGTDDTTDGDLVQRSIVDPADLPEASITEADREQFEADSAEVALLDYWEALQFQDLPVSLDFHAPGLRQMVGDANLIDALRYQSALYRATKPGIVDTTTQGELTTVRYLLQDLAGGEATHSIVFARRSGSWEIVYSSFTGDNLLASAQARAQARIDPSAQAPSSEAQAAGARVAQRQQDYLAKVEKRP